MENQKYKYTPEMAEISGFGGEYEEACRKMVIAGVEYLEANNNVDFSFKEYENIYGILAETDEETDKVINAMLQADKAFGASGGMVQATLSHVKYIQKNGWNKYVETMTKNKEEDYCEEICSCDPEPVRDTFEEEVRKLINKHSVENKSNTPDHILATYIIDCLDAYSKAVKKMIWGRDLLMVENQPLEEYKRGC